jgi:hypothetical protein
MHNLQKTVQCQNIATVQVYCRIEFVTLKQIELTASLTWETVILAMMSTKHFYVSLSYWGMVYVTFTIIFLAAIMIMVIVCSVRITPIRSDFCT